MTPILDTNSEPLVKAELSPDVSKKTRKKSAPKTGATPERLTATTWRVCVRKPEALGGAWTTISMRKSVRVELTELACGKERVVTDALRHVVARMTATEFVRGDVSELARKRAIYRLKHLARLAEIDAAAKNNAAWGAAE